MPRCSYAKPAFIKNRCRFGSFLELQSGLEMALASNRQWNGSTNRFGNAFFSHFHYERKSHQAAATYKTAHFDGSRLRLPRRRSRPKLNRKKRMCATCFHCTTSALKEPEQRPAKSLTFDTDRQTRSHIDRPTSNPGSCLAECVQRLNNVAQYISG